MTRLFLFSIFCAILGCANNPSRIDGVFNPVSVGKGPLLFFFVVESAEGKSSSDPNARVDVLYVFDPASSKEPQRIWQGAEPPLARPIARLCADFVVFEQGDTGFLLDMKSGGTTNLLATENAIEVVSVENGKVFFVEHQKKRQPLKGIKLETGKDDGMIVNEYVRPHNVLYVLDGSRSDRAEVLADVPVEEILFEDDLCFWVITTGTRGNDRKLCKIFKAGKVEEVVPFPNEWMASLTHVELSPNKRLLALGSADERNDYINEREMIVIDLEKKTIIFSKSKVIGLPAMFGGEPPFFLNWSDDDLLHYHVYSLDIKTGQEPSEERFKQSVLVTADPDIDKKTIGFFDLRHGEAYFKSDDNPIANVLDKSGTQTRDLAIDDSGNWVAFASTTADELYLVVGQNREKRLLFSGWSNDINWLPIQMSRFR